MQASYELEIKIIEDTLFGSLGVIWSRINGNPKIMEILIPKPELSVHRQLKQDYPLIKQGSTKEIDKICQDIVSFLEGDDVLFSLDIVELNLCSDFQRKVLLAEYNIPRGKVSTYQLIAKHIGLPKGARAVGNALANNPFPIVIPCHRAIRSDMTLGGFQGGLKMKKRLLENEGVEFDSKGRVLSDQLFY